MNGTIVLRRSCWRSDHFTPCDAWCDGQWAEEKERSDDHDSWASAVEAWADRAREEQEFSLVSSTEIQHDTRLIDSQYQHTQGLDMFHGNPIKGMTEYARSSVFFRITLTAEMSTVGQA